MDLRRILVCSLLSAGKDIDSRRPVAVRPHFLHGNEGTFVLYRRHSCVSSSHHNPRKHALEFRCPHAGSVGLRIDCCYGFGGGSRRGDYRSRRQDRVAARCNEGSSLMDSAVASESPKLRAATSSFVLAAALTAVFNTALACAKDTFAPLRNLMKSLTDHDWTTQGLVDILLFAGLGLFFMRSRITEQMN